jgi:hypothetical protein
MSEASKETHTMSIEIVDIADSILTVQITGTLAQPELAAAQSKVADIIQDNEHWVTNAGSRKMTAL